MASTADFKNGLCIKYNNDLFQIIEFLHVKPGKGPAFVRTKLKSITTGKVLDNTFNSGVKVETVRIETREHQYLYKDEQGYNFMNVSDYTQINVEGHQINAPQFLKEECICQIMFHAEEEMVLSVDLPIHMEVQITYTEPGIKGDTATNTLKPATIDTGVEIRVPLFVNEGDFIKVDTRTGDYIERVKK